MDEKAEAEAAAWLARLRSEKITTADRRAFQVWLSADSRHATAFEATNAVWEMTAALPRDLRGHRVKTPATNRRRVIARAGVFMAGTGTFAIWQSAQAQTYRTDVGEQKHIELEDGSQIFLDTDTRMRVGFSKTLRSVDLDYGRANFRIKADSNWPFVVSAADRKVVSTSSNFDVRRDDKRMSVVLINGYAVLQAASPGTHMEKLRGGERILATATETFPPDWPPLKPLLAWQTGRAIFENERLSDAVYEMNRYSNVKLKIEDVAISGLRLSGNYHVGDNLAFAAAVSKLLPVRTRETNDAVYLSSDGARAMPG